MRNKLLLTIFTVATLGATAVYADKNMADADVSGDGYVSLDEFKSAHDARVEERFTKMDANADGLLSEDEMKSAKKDRRGDRHRGRKNPEEKFNELDADGSGSVSMQELSADRFTPDAATFQAADIDGSGELDASELHAMKKERRGENRRGDWSKDD